jgi:uncharacterized protein (TIGR02118 family)
MREPAGLNLASGTARTTLSRRHLLECAGAGVTLGMLASTLGVAGPARADASASAGGVNCMTILYPAGEGITFDADYYRDHHLVTIMRLYGSSISRFELRKVAPAAGAEPVPFSAAVNIWIADMEAFAAGNAKHGKTLVEDVPNFSSVMPSAFPTVIHGIGKEPA